MNGRIALNEQRLKTLSSSTGLKERVAELINLGSRETGSDPHVKFIDQIAGELKSLGLPVHRDSYRFDRWSLSDRNLDCELKVDGKTVSVASAYPYSGLTGPNALSARLKLAG